MSDALTQTLAAYVEKLQVNYPEYKFENGNRSKYGETDKEGVLFVTYPDGMEKQYMIPSVLQGSVTVTIGAIERDIESYERAQSITTQSNPAYRAPKDAVILSEEARPVKPGKLVTVPQALPSPKYPGNSDFLVKSFTEEDVLNVLCIGHNIDPSVAGIHIEDGAITVYNKTRIQMK